MSRGKDGLRQGVMPCAWKGWVGEEGSKMEETEEWVPGLESQFSPWYVSWKLLAFVNLDSLRHASVLTSTAQGLSLLRDFLLFAA